MTLDASGNLGVGTTSPSVRLHVANSGDNVSYFERVGGSRVILYNASGDSYFGTTTNTPLRFATNDAERARIDSSGNLLIAKTSAAGGTAGIQMLSDGRTGITVNGDYSLWCNRLTSDGATIVFNRSTTQVGSISVTTTATAYNTSSDYRLKENIQDVTGSGAFIDALQPRTWNWKVDGSAGAGFIAHELQAVSPSSVTGTKDAVDADGNPEYQAVEYGSAEVIAMLVAEVKSLRKRLADAGIA
jgi:hypothetical protein